MDRHSQIILNKTMDSKRISVIHDKQVVFQVWLDYVAVKGW